MSARLPLRSLADDPWCVLAGALLSGGVAPLAPAPVTLAFGICLLLLGARWTPWLFLVAMGAFVLGWTRGKSSYDEFEQVRREAIEFIGGPRRCSAQVRVARSPVVREGVVSWVGDAVSLDCEGRQHPGPLRLSLYGGPQRLVRGDTLDVVAQLAPVRLFRNVDLPDPLPSARRRGAVLSGSVLSAALVAEGRGLLANIDAARTHSRSRIEATFPELARPMARALVLGENDLDPVDDDAFKRSGLMHLLAVSGTHLVFAVVLVVQALRACLCRIETLARRFDVARVSSAAGVAASLLYADFSGGSGSAWRAAWMLSAVFLARTLGCKMAGARALGVSLAAGAGFDPFAAVDLSFALSAAATWGLLVLGQPLAGRLQFRSPALRYVALGTIATITSTLPCAPLLALMDERLTAAGLIANLFAAPLGELAALPACLLHAAVSFLPSLEQGLALVGAGALLAVRWIALRSAEATFASFVVPLPNAWHLCLLMATVALAGAIPSGRHRSFLLLSSLGALLLIEHGARHRPTERLQATILDIGQGDATLVDLPNGSTLLIDGGGFPHGFPDPGERVILPVLRARRQQRVDVMVLSHAHADHLQGLLAVLRRHPVEELWHPAGAAPPHGQYGELLRLAEERGTRVVRADQLCGWNRQFGEARVEVLGPCPVKPGVGLNDNSLVLRVSYGKRSLLFTGDAERDQEERLLASGFSLRADILKAGHHGSNTSSSLPFLRAVRPRWATISSGVRNRFAHPRPDTLRAFQEQGIATLRTDRSGSLVFTTDGSLAQWTVFSAPW